jgi:DcaP outer membrane protein
MRRPNQLFLTGIIVLLVCFQQVRGQQSTSTQPRTQQELQEEVKLQQVVIDQQAKQLEEQKMLLVDIAKRLDQLEKKQSGEPVPGQVTMVPAVASSTTDRSTIKPVAPENVDQANTKANKFLEEGIMPGSIKIPGTDISMKLGGYVKLDFIQDFDGIGNVSQFKTDTIPINGTPNADLGALTTFQAIETRFNVDFRGDTERGKFRAFFEGDFYGQGNTFRIRHAFGEFGNLLAGQTWTTFMDISARPRSLDYEGPDAEIFVRQAMIRWTQPLSRHWKVAFAVENPGGQFVTAPGLSGSARSHLPDFPAFLRYDSSRGHFQVATLLRQIRFDGTAGSPDVTTLGWGVNSTFKLNTTNKNGLMGQFAFGSGIGRYLESTAGQNADAVFRSGNTLKALPARAGVLGYQHHWNRELQSNIAYAIADLSSDVGQPATFIKRTQDARVNLIWSPYRLIDFGGEFLWGRRDNRDGSHGDARRFQLSFIYNFNSPQ